MLASINGTDITEYIQESTYKMDKEDVFEEWEDANWKKHHENPRKRVSGSFDMVFVTDQAFNDFLILRDANTDASGKLTITVHVSNTNTDEEIEAFYEFNTSSDRKISNTHVYKRFSMKIEEA